MSWRIEAKCRVLVASKNLIISRTLLLLHAKSLSFSSLSSRQMSIDVLILQSLFK